MKKILTLILASLLLACIALKSKIDDPMKWVSLFNGENLEGWQIKIAGHELDVNIHETFRVEEGMLKIRYDKYDNYGTQYGAIYTDKAYSNYRLRMEYRFTGDTAVGSPGWGYRDSGVQYHCQDPKTIEVDQSFPFSLEYNLHGGDENNERPTGQICANGTLITLDGEVVKGCQQPNPAVVIKGDDWAILEIDVQGAKIKQFINGVEVLSFSNPRLDPEHAVAKTFIKQNEMLTNGFISLQSNSHPIDFRKIEIMVY
ncbi:MAG: hypothetical protein ACI9DJ_000951 [Algoriphagus sp.]|jgi:hypothetical protein